MEGFTTSDSSDGELSASGKVDLSHQSLDLNSLQLSIESKIEQDKNATENVETLILCHNRMNTIPQVVCAFHNLKVLDISYNNITKIPCYVEKLPLTSFICKNASLENKALPKSFGATVKELNLSGNNLTEFPMQALDMSSLKYLYLGGNKIESIPKDIPRASKLNILSLGSNRLIEVPESLGGLCWLQVLVLSDNQLESLPPAIANLKNLKSLLLHRNRLRTLPPEIIALKCLTELSLRDNPLVVRFVSDMTHNPPSLMELAARLVKQHSVAYNPLELPRSLHEYLESAHHCVNPKCKGVFFDNRVEHIKFVDFCGKYRIPLLQYLCSSKCVAGFNASRRSADRPNHYMMKKVLLG